MKILRMKCKDGINKPEYRFYVIVETKDGLKIESGWKEEKEAKDMKRELPTYFKPQVYPKNKLQSIGLTIERDSDWYK